MDYNPFLPEVKDNPYSYYAHLRRHAPVYQVEASGFWAVSRYDDVLFVLKNPQLFSSSVLIAALLGDLNPVPEAASLIASDPPVHTRLRKLVNRAFTPRIIADLEPRMREITSHLIKRVAPQGEFDLVKDLSTPLPVIVIAEMLGVEPDHREDFKRWSDDIVSAANGMLSGEERGRIRQSVDEFRAYFQEAIGARRVEPRTDLITVLVRAEEENQALTSGEVLSLTTLLLIAGNETTTNLIGNIVLALFDHPDEWAKVRADPSLIPNLVEETLRYDGPVQGIFRQATQDVELAGTTIPAGAAGGQGRPGGAARAVPRSVAQGRPCHAGRFVLPARSEDAAAGVCVSTKSESSRVGPDPPYWGLHRALLLLDDLVSLSSQRAGWVPSTDNFILP